jgi:sugar transferase EpsL
LTPRRPRAALAAKRLLDVAAAGLGLVLASPLMLAVAVAVRVRLGSPVLFRQARPGLRREPFQMLKFRTMRPPRPGEDAALTDARRLTPLGRFLRRASLDELPELWNVLRGDMSLVGPRPLLTQYLPYFTERESLRFAVRPGITGLAQVSGRNNAGWNDRLELDARYVEEWSLALDLRILARTAAAVARSDGVLEDPRAVMPNLDEERAGRPAAAARGG